MSFGFRKRVKIAKGVHLNLSKGGISASVGRPGATVNIGKKGVKGTAGIPGTGLTAQRQLIGGTKKAPKTPEIPEAKASPILTAIIVVAIIGGVFWGFSKLIS